MVAGQVWERCQFPQFYNFKRLEQLKNPSNEEPLWQAGGKRCVLVPVQCQSSYYSFCSFALPFLSISVTWNGLLIHIFILKKITEIAYKLSKLFTNEFYVNYYPHLQPFEAMTSDNT